MAAGLYIGAAGLVLIVTLGNYLQDFSSVEARSNLVGKQVLEDSAAANRTRSTPTKCIYALNQAWARCAQRADSLARPASPTAFDNLRNRVQVHIFSFVIPYW